MAIALVQLRIVTRWMAGQHLALLIQIGGPLPNAKPAAWKAVPAITIIANGVNRFTTLF